MKFYKYCGAGNDFVLLENFDGALKPAQLPELARRLCDRHFGVGADGLMVVEPPRAGGDCSLRFLNADGSLAEMCGNGARCLCRHCFDRGLSGDAPRLETDAGLVVGRRLAADRYRLRLNRPSEFRQGLALPAASPAPNGVDYVVLGENGIPHAVVPLDAARLDGDRDSLRAFARALRHDAAFPKGANVNLCAVTAPDTVRLVTFERGVEDFTLACGTGVGSTVFALTRRGLVSGRGVRVLTDGGTLLADTDGVDLDLTGPAQRSFVGEFDDPLYLIKEDELR